MPTSKRKQQRPAQNAEQNTRITHTEGNVLDLRSIVAQRDARRSQKIQEQAATQEKKQSRKKVVRQVQKKAKQSAQKIKKRPKKRATPAKVKTVQKGRPAAPKKTPKQQKEPVHPPSHRALISSVILFIIGLCVFLSPAFVGVTVSHVRTLEERVTGSATTAFERLQVAADFTQQLEASQARAAFQESQEAFALAQSQVEPFDSLMPAAKAIPFRGDEISSGWSLLQAGYELALAGEQITKAMEEFNATDITSVARDEDVGITRLLLIAYATVSPTQEHVARAVEHLEAVDVDAVPEEKRELAAQVQSVLPQVNGQLTEATQMIELLLAMLGNERERRYAVIFANNHELRAGMGFPGAVAFVDVRNGVVTNIDIPGGGVYDISGQLTEKVVAPKPLHLVNPHWSLQDSLWFPHFPASAEKFQWFLAESAAPSVDGVIALTPSVIEDVLEVTGPIDLQSSYGLIIDENNFYEEVQLLAEEKFDQTQKSKQIIADMTPILFNKLFSASDDPEQLAAVVEVMSRALDEKNIVMYMNDDMLQRSVSALDWGGEIKTTEGDYLAVINDNIAGGKTNSVVEDTIQHRAQIAADGTITNTVTYTLNHLGEGDDLLQGTNYTGFVRFYVPEGSELLSAEGFETPESQLFISPDDDARIDEDLKRISGDVLVNELTQVSSNTEFQKQMFGGWMQAEAGGSATVTLTYTLPFVIGNDEVLDPVDQYTLLVQKQLGSFGTILESEVVTPENMRVTRAYPDAHTGVKEVLLVQDYFMGLIIEQS
jgi:hypothetical protein